MADNDDRVTPTLELAASGVVADKATLRELLAAATPGPWELSYSQIFSSPLAQQRCAEEERLPYDATDAELASLTESAVAYVPTRAGDEPTRQGLADALLICAIRNAIPALLDAHDRLVTIIDDAFGLQPVQPTEELLTFLERQLFEARRERGVLEADLDRLREENAKLARLCGLVCIADTLGPGETLTVVDEHAVVDALTSFMRDRQEGIRLRAVVEALPRWRQMLYEPNIEAGNTPGGETSYRAILAVRDEMADAVRGLGEK
jgi:hypothetical protein